LSAQYKKYFIANYSERLRIEGLSVINIIENETPMPSFNGVQPTIYANDGSLERIIVVKTEDDYAESKGDLDKLKQYVQSNQGVSFWGFTISQDSWNLIENII
jgi:hypothetical protein